MANADYLLHMFRRLQSNNLEVSILIDGDRGVGKSNSVIYLILKYLDMFSFVCPHCGTEFYKSVYATRKNQYGKTEFYIPDYVKNGEAVIKCPEQYELDLETKQKTLRSGCGKTFKWSERKKVKFTPEKFIAYDTKQVIEKLQRGVKGQPILCDEAFDALAAQNHAKSEQKFLKQLITTVRPKNYLIWWAVPNKNFLDNKISRQYSSFHMRCIDRGIIAIFEKDKGITADPYHVKEMEKIFGVVKFFTDKTKILNGIKKHPCYFDTIKVGKIPDKIYDEYEYYRNALTYQRQVEEASFDKKDHAKLMVWNFMKNWDRIKISVDKTKDNRPTYSILVNELAVDPLTRKSLFSDVTARNWLSGVERYIKSQGKEVAEFVKKTEAESEEQKKTRQELDKNSEITDLQL